MNIFVLDKNPKLAAQYQCDKHVVKMILESAQLLCSPFDEAPYRRTHYNHPCAKWVRQSADNFQWLVQHALALCAEYTFRYSKRHKSQDVIEWCTVNATQLELPNAGLTEFAQAMPDECKNADVVAAYRDYYRTHKRDFAKWTLREIPGWFNDSTNI